MGERSWGTYTKRLIGGEGYGWFAYFYRAVERHDRYSINYYDVYSTMHESIGVSISLSIGVSIDVSIGISIGTLIGYYYYR